MAVIPVQTNPGPSGELLPRQRDITVVGAAGATSFGTTGETYLVFTPELALQCELSGLDFVYVNLAQVLALGVGVKHELALPLGPPPRASGDADDAGDAGLQGSSEELVLNGALHEEDD